jgi:hypothetical protein
MSDRYRSSYKSGDFRGDLRKISVGDKSLKKNKNSAAGKKAKA